MSSFRKKLKLIRYLKLFVFEFDDLSSFAVSLKYKIKLNLPTPTESSLPHAYGIWIFRFL